MDRIATIRRMLEAEPGDGLLTHALALEYEKAGRRDDAIRELAALLHANPAYTGSYYHLGRMLAEAGRTEEAKEWYGKGLVRTKAAGEARAASEIRAALDELDELDD